MLDNTRDHRMALARFLARRIILTEALLRRDLAAYGERCRRGQFRSRDLESICCAADRLTLAARRYRQAYRDWLVFKSKCRGPALL